MGGSTNDLFRDILEMAGRVSEATRESSRRSHWRSHRSRLDDLDRELNRDYRVMDRRKFGAVLRSLEMEAFDSDKLDVIKITAKSEHCISGNQLDKILDCFSFDGDRLRAVKLLAHKVVSPEAATLRSFGFSSDRSEARRILAR